MSTNEPKCSDHPDAPHGFDRNASHNAGRHVCECESWAPPEEATTVETIDTTPSWGAIGLLFWRLAVSNEQAALRAGHKEFAKAFAFAEAVRRLQPTFTPEQQELLTQVTAEELVKQGV